MHLSSRNYFWEQLEVYVASLCYEDRISLWFVSISRSLQHLVRRILVSRSIIWNTLISKSKFKKCSWDTFILMYLVIIRYCIPAPFLWKCWATIRSIRVFAESCISLSISVDNETIFEEFQFWVSKHLRESRSRPLLVHVRANSSMTVAIRLYNTLKLRIVTYF